MANDGADESNLHTEKKYQKDAKIGEGTYAVVYQGKPPSMDVHLTLASC